MEPLGKKVREAILEANPQASPQDIDEYERLLSLTFSTNPDAPSGAPERAALIDDENVVSSRSTVSASLNRVIW